MFQLLNYLFTIVTFICPGILTIKALDKSVQFNYSSYQFLLNYWLYFILLQYIQQLLTYNTVNTLSIINYSIFAIKFWLFYGKNNNLKLINKILIDKSITNQNLHSIETKFINPLLNRINPEFVELNFQVYQLGTTYLKPIPTGQEVNIVNFTRGIFQTITTIVAIFSDAVVTAGFTASSGSGSNGGNRRRIKGSSASSSNTATTNNTKSSPSSSSSILRKIRKLRQSSSNHNTNGTVSPDVRSRSSSIGNNMKKISNYMITPNSVSSSNQSIHSSTSSITSGNRSNLSYPTSPIISPATSPPQPPSKPYNRNVSSPPPYDEIINIPEVSLSPPPPPPQTQTNYPTTTIINGGGNSSNSSRRVSRSSAGSFDLDSTIMAFRQQQQQQQQQAQQRSMSPAATSSDGMRRSTNSMTRLQEVLGVRGNNNNDNAHNNDLPPAPTPAMISNSR